MWLSRFLIAYLALVTYVFIRARSRLDRPGLKTVFSLSYVLLVLAFPVAEILAHRSGSDASRHLQVLGFYSLPYLLYLFLTVFFMDILSLAGRLLKFLRGGSSRNGRLRRVALWVTFMLPLAVVI